MTVVEEQRERMNEKLRRHVRAEDAALSDHDFIMMVVSRYCAARRDLLIDPNE